MKQAQNFGAHLMIDGYECDESKLSDMDSVFTILETLPTRLGMTPLITPYVVKAPPANEKDPGGYSGFVMIKESHISIHTFPATRFVSIDVYTCQNSLDKKTIINFFTKFFEIKIPEIHYVKRGTRYAKYMKHKTKKDPKLG